MDEYLDLVDEDDNVIDRKLRSEVHRQKLRNYRAVNVFIINSKGELWIPRRTASKDIYPLGLDFSCAGHVSSGETYEATLQREMMEELNIDVREHMPRHIGMLTPREGFPCFAKVYDLIMDVAPNYNREDYIEYQWLTPTALLERIEAGDYAKSGLPIAVRRFYSTTPNIPQPG